MHATGLAYQPPFIITQMIFGESHKFQTLCPSSDCFLCLTVCHTQHFISRRYQNFVFKCVSAELTAAKAARP